MKKFIKLAAVSSLALLLVACSNEEDKEPETTAPESASQVEESSSESDQSQASDNSQESTDENSSSDESGDLSDDSQDIPDESGDQAVTDAVKFTFYTNGEETPFQEFEVEDGAGLSVLEAMEQIDGLDFNFDEAEGVIDTIGDYTNDYELGETWAYLYNGQYAELGVVSQTLEAGDEIAWYFGSPDDIPMNLIPAEDGQANDTEDTMTTSEETEESSVE